MVGKGKDTHCTTASEHQSRPLASLKDPDTFGPPPKNLAYHGSAATPHASYPDEWGLDASVAAQQVQATEEQHQRKSHAAEEADQEATAPRVPYRADTTDLSTRHLPKPPVRRLGYDDQPSALPTSPSTKSKPALPPRLPPRQSPAPARDTLGSPPMYTGATHDQTPKSYINQEALNRLGSAGVSVPGFGMGRGSYDANPWQDQQGSNTSGVSQGLPDAQAPQLSELQLRFSKISTQSPSTPTKGTSFAQKQAAFKTASSFRNDTSSTTLSDVKATASTADNFRVRHGDQVAAGWKTAGALNKKYDVANKVNGFSASGSVPPNAGTHSDHTDTTTLDQVSSPTKKRAPPPPPKRPLAESHSASSPPPIPLYSKPQS